MFLGVKHKFPFLTPLMTVPMVRDQIVSILESNRSQEVYLPFYAKFLPLLKMFPIEYADALKSFMGANDDMKNWKGSVSSL
jgi:hypothetical protein